MRVCVCVFKCVCVWPMPLSISWPLSIAVWPLMDAAVDSAVAFSVTIAAAAAVSVACCCFESPWPLPLHLGLEAVCDSSVLASILAQMLSLFSRCAHRSLY